MLALVIYQRTLAYFLKSLLAEAPAGPLSPGGPGAPGAPFNPG
jgi:hypothetical protein